ncbi:class I SAM-dependent methyltransferase [Nocardia blacklockiae]|nr:class I SAM-dependent methyltransferase [Nocardia blacklockiae]
MAAAARAAHLLVDREPFLFEDTAAARLLGDQAEELLSYHRLHGDHLVLAGTRAQVAVRGHFTESRLAASGLGQYVILGAGLDTFAYRSPLAREVAVFEVDHPDTQRWKRAALASAGLGPLGEIAFVPVDFERDDLMCGLVAHGFDRARPAVVNWLGVTMYLTPAALETTVAALSACAPATELIVEYALPPELRDEPGRAYAELVAPAAAERGEPWLGTQTPEEMSHLLARHGFRVAEHVTQRAAVPAAAWERSDVLRPSDLCRLVRAVRA